MKTNLGKMNHQLTLLSGGQTGVDRAALDYAIQNHIHYGGWCPQGGLAEDLLKPPGLLKQYPELKETPSSDYLQRTEWNVRDSDATLIIAPNWILAKTGGTGLTIEYAAKYRKPCLLIYPKQSNASNAVRQWLADMDRSVQLNIAGPRASKAPNIYQETYQLLQQSIHNNHDSLSDQ